MADLEMPEGPEVRIIGQYLERLCQGQTLLSIQYPASSKEPKGLLQWAVVKSKSSLITAYLYAKVERVLVYGKVIIFELSRQVKNTAIIRPVDQTPYPEERFWLLSKLQMTGRWQHFLEANNGKISQQPRYWLNIGLCQADHDVVSFRLYYYDVRPFGYLSLQAINATSLTSTVGPDLLRTALALPEIQVAGQTLPNLSLEHLIKVIRSKPDRPLCKLLMEQKHLAGVGNYLKAEILYRAGLHPETLVGQAFNNEGEIANFFQLMLVVIREAYLAGGLTISDYAQPQLDGYYKPGLYQPAVYQRTTDPMGRAVISLSTSDGRKTYLVPSWQILR